jgi:hypothetical protein
VSAEAQGAGEQDKANPYAVALVEFQKRVKAYLALRDKVKASLPPSKPTGNPAELVARQERLAEAVRHVRQDAHPGSVFTVAIAPFIRSAIALDFKSRTPAQRAAALQEVPSGLALKVDDAYPKEVPLATVPAKLLAALPQLPDGLEYRFVGRRLILHDTETNLVVDILDHALPPR